MVICITKFVCKALYRLDRTICKHSGSASKKSSRFVRRSTIVINSESVRKPLQICLPRLTTVAAALAEHQAGHGHL